MTYLISIPIYRELPHIEPNLFSLNDWENLMIIDNSISGWAMKFQEYGAKVIHHPENIGVARAWNETIREGADYTFFVSSSVFWPKGFRELEDHLRRLIAEGVPGIENGIFCNLGWHANSLSKKAIERVGFFDECCYPSYTEDVDMCRRLYLAGLHPDSRGITLGGTIPGVVIEARPIDIAVTIKQTKLAVNFDALGRYYRSKWGDDKPNETFDLPFGNMPIDYFPKKTIEQLKAEYQL